MAAAPHAGHSAPRTVRHPILFVFSVLLAPALWVAFVATGNPHELVVGAFTSLATVAFTLMVCRSSSEELTLRPRDLIQLWRIPWYLVSDGYQIVAVAFKDLLGIAPAQSLFRVCGFDTSTHDPVRRARTILAVAYSTATPNSIVIGVDPAQSRMLFHQLKSTPIPRMTRALGAKA